MAMYLNRQPQLFRPIKTHTLVYSNWGLNSELNTFFTSESFHLYSLKSCSVLHWRVIVMGVLRSLRHHDTVFNLYINYLNLSLLCTNEMFALQSLKSDQNLIEIVEQRKPLNYLTKLVLVDKQCISKCNSYFIFFF